MPYTEAFMNEVFRYGSITPLAVHANPEETTLGGYRIPKRTWVIGNIYGIHWDKKVGRTREGQGREAGQKKDKKHGEREAVGMWEDWGQIGMGQTVHEKVGRTRREAWNRGEREREEHARNGDTTGRMRD